MKYSISVNSTQSVHPDYRPDIDGLRAIAVLSVVVFHAFPAAMPGGFIGVDIFFVISGYLISTIIFRNLEHGTFSFGDFYSRRIRRIFPSLIIVLITTYIFGWLILFPEEYKQLGQHIAAGSTFVSNLILWSEAGYFDNSADTKPLLHLWSLGIEEQFYIVWPLLVWIAAKSRLDLLKTSLLLATSSFFLNLYGVNSDSIATFYSPQTRFWELLIGGLLAWKENGAIPQAAHYGNEATAESPSARIGASIRRIQPASKDILSGLGALFLLFGFMQIDKNSPFPGVLALLPVLGAMLLIAAGSTGSINRTLLSNRLLDWFGLISFPLYLWHWPILAYIRIVDGTHADSPTLMAAVLLAIMAAAITYYLVERPVRFRTSRKKTLVFLLGGMIAVGCLGYNTYQRKGLSFRLKNTSPEVQKLMANPRPDVSSIDCEEIIPELKGLKFNSGCSLSKPKPPSIAFIGDSHTFHYRKAAWDHFPDTSIMMAVETGCLPFPGDKLAIDTCRAKYDALTGYLGSSKTIKTIVLSGYWSYIASWKFANSSDHWRSPALATPEDIKKFEVSVAKLITPLIKSGKRIVFMKDIPDLDFNINSCFGTPTLRKPRAEVGEYCALSFDKYKQRAAPYDAVIDRVLSRFPEVVVYDPRPLFCHELHCRATDGSLPYYFNGDHLNYFGAEMVMTDMLSKIRIES